MRLGVPSVAIAPTYPNIPTAIVQRPATPPTRGGWACPPHARLPSEENGRPATEATPQDFGVERSPRCASDVCPLGVTGARLAFAAIDNCEPFM